MSKRSMMPVLVQHAVQEPFRVRRRRSWREHRFAWGVAGLVGLVALAAGCASATSARSGPSAVPATCGSVGTNDFSAATVLYRADPDALPCLAQAMTTCRPESLDIWQTAVDSGDDYRLTITGSATNGCEARLADTGFVLGPVSPDPTPITAECIARMHDTDVLLVCPDGTYLLPSTVASPQPIPSVTPPATTPSPLPTQSSTVARQPTEGPTSYPTGDNAQRPTHWS